MDLFCSFMNSIGPIAIFWVTYEYSKLKLKETVSSKLGLKAISSIIAYLCTSIVYLLIFNNVHAFIYFISFPVITVFPEIYYRAKGIKKPTQWESPLVGFKYKSHNELKIVAPWIAAFIILTIAYFLHFILWSLDKAVSS